MRSHLVYGAWSSPLSSSSSTLASYTRYAIERKREWRREDNIFSPSLISSIFHNFHNEPGETVTDNFTDDKF